MNMSQKIFALRKAKQLDEAYQLVTELMAQEIDDAWEIKACAWCLIDLIKREAQLPQSALLPALQQQLTSLKIDHKDGILKKQLEALQSLSSPFGQDALRAKALAKDHHYSQALAIYREIFTQYAVNDQQIHMSYGWTLYQYGKALWTENPKQHINTVKRLLNEYFKLNTEKPSILHSCILKLARSLAKDGQLRIAPFFRMWGDQFMDEDYHASEDKNNTTYSPFAETILQMVAKEVIRANDRELLHFILPRLQQCIEKFNDNIWFKYYLAKTFLALGQHQEARVFCINVCKAKQSESWAWGLLAEVYRDHDSSMTLACYCKALLCKNEEKLKINLRKQLAQMLMVQGLYPEAKFEILTALQNIDKIQSDLISLTQQDWYQHTEVVHDNLEFYHQHADRVDDIVYENLPWLNANMGDKFVIPDTKKTKYKIFIKTEHDTVEASVSEHQIKNLNAIMGQPLQVKGEFDEKNIFRVYLVSQRTTGETWDALSTYLAVVDSINHEKKLFHFIVDKTKDGVVPFHATIHKVQEGDVIEVATAAYTSKSGTRLRVINLQPSIQNPSIDILKIFHKEIVEKNGNVGFTSYDYFIPPYLMEKHQLISGNRISGQAVMNFNSKKRKWGWKVITITEKLAPESYDDEYDFD
ncbi:tetratricopeptide repeat protein [Acinetobacter soli]|uniref:tetratricopeptide repeat protein n=1 Tax=Acinetobacter soli TaxID=487316 RepID=UPI00370B0650